MNRFSYSLAGCKPDPDKNPAKFGKCAKRQIRLTSLLAHYHLSPDEKELFSQILRQNRSKLEQLSSFHSLDIIHSLEPKNTQVPLAADLYEAVEGDREAVHMLIRAAWRQVRIQIHRDFVMQLEEELEHDMLRHEETCDAWMDHASSGYYRDQEALLLPLNHDDPITERSL